MGLVTVSVSRRSGSVLTTPDLTSQDPSPHFAEPACSPSRNGSCRLSEIEMGAPPPSARSPRPTIIPPLGKAQLMRPLHQHRCQRKSESAPLRPSSGLHCSGLGSTDADLTVDRPVALNTRGSASNLWGRKARSRCREAPSKCPCATRSRRIRKQHWATSSVLRLLTPRRIPVRNRTNHSSTMADPFSRPFSKLRRRELTAAGPLRQHPWISMAEGAAHLTTMQPRKGLTRPARLTRDKTHRSYQDLASTTRCHGHQQQRGML